MADDGGWCRCCSTPASLHCAVPKLKTFGTGKSAFQITPVETTVFDYNVSSASSFGVMTHFWLTGGPSPGSGTDNTTVRYYVDGEVEAAIQFKPPLATGTGFDDLTVWGTAKAGHGATDGAWFINCARHFFGVP